MLHEAEPRTLHPPSLHCAPRISRGGNPRRLATQDAGAFDDALLALSVEEIEEAAGELHRRIAAALRWIGEQRADVTPPGFGARSPRWQVAALLASTELAGLTFEALAGGDGVALPRLDRRGDTIAALMYAAPTIGALLTRLEQDRRLLASLARGLDGRLDETRLTPWGHDSARRLLVTVCILDAARCALVLEETASTSEV